MLHALHVNYCVNSTKCTTCSCFFPVIFPLFSRPIALLAVPRFPHVTLFPVGVSPYTCFGYVSMFSVFIRFPVMVAVIGFYLNSLQADIEPRCTTFFIYLLAKLLAWI